MIPTIVTALWVRKKYIVLGFSAGVVFGLMVGAVGRTALPLSLDYVKANTKVDQPLIISLNQHIKPIDVNTITITPNVEGKWQFIQPSIMQRGRLVFTPKTYFKEYTKYSVAVPEAERVFGPKTAIPPVTFTTERAPSLATTGAASWKDGQTIAADARVSASLVSANHHLRELELRTTPQIAMTRSVANDKDYTWKSTDTWPQNTDITFELYDTKNRESLMKKTVHVAAEPALTSPLHRDSVDERDTITLTFGSAVDPATAKISFDLAGRGTWQNDTSYVFRPEKLAPGTTYHYTVAAGMRSRDGGILKNDISGSFATIGPVTVAAMSPYGNGLAQAAQTLSFTFNRPVDHASAEQRLSVSSGQVTSKWWKGNTLYAAVNNLGFQQTFSATIASGVTNAAFGLPSARSFGLSFSTETRSVKLNVPMFRQQHSGTCTAASLRMILSYRGIGSDEIGLVNAMGYNPRSIDKSTDPATWDDPQTMFVGSIDGSIANGTGAGPDAPPVAKASRAYGRSAASVSGIGPGWIAQQLYDGNPVIMFGSWRNTGLISWKTPTGASRVMNLTGHATVVIGVKGEPSNPLGFWVNDPLSGASYWTVGQVAANIARDPDRQAVVVY